MKSLYANCTDITGAQAREIKANLRNALAVRRATVTRIYRNPFTDQRTRYRFLRIEFTTKD